MKCTSCSELQICEYCNRIICTECTIFCNDKCNGTGTHCKECIYPEDTYTTENHTENYTGYYVSSITVNIDSFFDTNYNLCDNPKCNIKTCKECKYKCNICYNELCIDCFGIINNESGTRPGESGTRPGESGTIPGESGTRPGICKTCLWINLIKNTKNDLYKKFPVEIIEMIGEYFVI